jgi:hypothetical protein
LKNGGIPSDFFFKSLFVMSLIGILALIKVYISNKIYYESRKINKLTMEVIALKEEKSILNMSIEKLSYKADILDNIEADRQEKEGNKTISSKVKKITPEIVKQLFGNRNIGVIEIKEKSPFSDQNSSSTLQNQENNFIEKE